MKLYTINAEKESKQLVKIYKVRLWVLKEKRGGGFHGEPIENMEQVVIGNLELAQGLYRDYRGRYSMWKDQKGYRGFVELYEAFIDERGLISGYPRGENYIERETTEA